MGYYQGLGGRLVVRATGSVRPGAAPADAHPGVNTVECPWAPTLTLSRSTTHGRPGNYLLKLVGDGTGRRAAVRPAVRPRRRQHRRLRPAEQRHHLAGLQPVGRLQPLLRRRPPRAASDFANRARVVSFDRPYPQTWAQGAADFFGNEFPLLYHMESLGLDITYWTDVDLHARPQLWPTTGACSAWATTSTGPPPCAAAPSRPSTRGTNLAFLGANACYRQIRLETSPVGPNRRQVCYKDCHRGSRCPASTTPWSPVRLGVATGQPAGEHADRQHVPVGAGQRRPGRHRRLVMVLRRLQPRPTDSTSPTWSRVSTTATSPSCRAARPTSTSWRTRRSPARATIGPTSPTTP